jgi:hypothetical protein
MWLRIKSKVGEYKFEYKTILVLALILIAALTIDTSIVKIAAFTGGLGSGISVVMGFAALTITFTIIQYIILRFIKKINEQNELNKRLRLNRMHMWITLSLYILTGILFTIVLEMVITSSYSLILVELTVLVSFILGLTMLGVLFSKLLFWFKSGKSALTLAYLLATSMIFINAVFGILYVTDQLTDIYQTRSTTVQPVMAFVGNYNQPDDIYNNGYSITYVVSFAVTWVATVLLLRNYSSKLGRTKYWILTTLPLLYFMSQFGYVFLSMLTDFRLMYPVLFGVIYTLFFSGTTPAGGILFGVAFWSIAHNITNNMVKHYMMISAFGMIILFSANQVSGLVRFFYPPFGIITLSSFGIASYLLLLGIYASAVSVAGDSNLRHSIRSFAIRESSLLDSIGEAQMQQQIQKRVMTLTKRNQDMMAETVGVQSSLSDEDIRQYLDQVLYELQKKASTNHGTDIK